VGEEQSKSVTAKLISHLPAITGAALLILSRFNIGYFSKIGLHFLGVMDFSNLVYSLSFIIAMLTGSLGVYFWGDYIESLLKNVGDSSGRRKIAWALGLFLGFSALTTAIVVYFFPQVAVKHFPIDRVVATFFVISSVVFIAFQYVHWMKNNKIGIGNGFYSFVIVILSIYYTGRAVAEHEIYTVKTTYDFTLKDLAAPLVGKILRSSSTGFIIFADNRVVFVPQGEIKQVRATDELKD
jgi:hypothetical protein